MAEDWSAGFLEAVSLHAENWCPLFEDDDAFLAIAPIIVAGHDIEDLHNMGVKAHTKAFMSLELPNVLTGCLARMRDTLAHCAQATGNDSTAPALH